MDDKQIYLLYSETVNYTDPDAFASDAALSLLDPDDPDQEVDMSLFDQLHALWHVANAPFKGLLERMGLNQTECSTRFCIPRRTVQNWAGEINACPLYTRLMMAEAMGLIRIRDNVPASR